MAQTHRWDERLNLLHNFLISIEGKISTVMKTELRKIYLHSHTSRSNRGRITNTIDIRFSDSCCNKPEQAFSSHMWCNLILSSTVLTQINLLVYSSTYKEDTWFAEAKSLHSNPKKLKNKVDSQHNTNSILFLNNYRLKSAYGRFHFVDTLGCINHVKLVKTVQKPLMFHLIAKTN